ncbi:MAG: hypothetical protein Q7T03_09920 [Deltaproteobacteria bacterium]|nr:hypothetical protein [Deltaproteobacteria bacterium]
MTYDGILPVGRTVATSRSVEEKLRASLSDFKSAKKECVEKGDQVPCALANGAWSEVVKFTNLINGVK